MATTVGQHSVSTFATPVNGGPLDANVVRGNDNTIRSAYVAHDADTGIHVQSSTLATRPAAGTAGRKWITADTGIFKLWYDDGTTWHEVGTSTIDVYVLADENLVKGDIIKVTGYNVGNGAPRVAKVSSASDVAFGIVNGTIASGAVGYVTNTGLIIDLNTNAFAIGDILYPNTSGGLTTTKPTSGNYQPVAFVLRSNTNNGVLYVEFSAPRIVERSDNTASTVVLRDASGNFSAGTITAGALTSTGLVTFASLKGTGATTVTNIINDGTMATASATTLATSSSIKTYVDSQVATVDTLAEVLANGNTTGANNIIVSSGQKITTNTIDETTAAAGVTIDSVLLKDNEVTATGVRVTNLKANDGTAAGSIANSTGVVTLGSSVLTTTDINGGTVDGTTIGASVPAAATFTNITSAGTINLTGATVSNGGSVTTIDINGGTIDGTTIGGASPAAGTFTTINATDINATTFDMTNLEVTNIKAKDGTASMTIADTTGNVTVSAALVANGNVTLGNATSDTITMGGSFPTGTKLRTDSSVGNTLAVSAYDVDGTAYVDLITATASNTPTLALTSTGVGSMNNIAIGGTTPAAGAFTTLDSSGDFAVATNKFTVASATGNTAVAGTLTTTGTLTSNGNTVLGSDATDTITSNAQFVTGTQLKSAQSANNTLSLSAYDVDGTAYVDLVKLTAGNTPTLTLTSTGTGSMDNITIGGSTAAAGSFTTLSASGNFTLGADVVLSRGAANRLDLASGDSLNVVSGDIQIGGSTVISSTSAGTLTSLTVSGNTSLASSSGGVGIGVAAGSSKLNVAGTFTKNTGDENTWGIRVTDDTAMTTGVGGGLVFVGNYTSGGGKASFASIAGAKANSTTANGLGELRFYTTDASSILQQRAVIDGSGNLAVDTNTLYVDAANNRVGVGTASPGTTFHVNAPSGSNTNIALSENDSIKWYIGNVTGSSTFRFYDNTAGAERLRIDASGNLGVGTSSPTDTGGFGRVVDVQGSTGAQVVCRDSDDTTKFARLSFDGGTTNVASVGAEGTATQVAFRAGGGEKMRLDASGNLGLGVTPSYQFDLLTPTSATDRQAVRINYGTSVGRAVYFGIDAAVTGTTYIQSATPSSVSSGTDLALNPKGGNVGVGTTSGNGKLSVRGPGTTTGYSFEAANSAGTTRFIVQDGGLIQFLSNTGGTESGRFTSGGYFKASNDGAYANSTGLFHEFRNTTNAASLYITSTNAAFTSSMIFGDTVTAAGTGFNLVRLQANAVDQFIVRGDGTIFAQNTTVQAISDARLKENVASYSGGWDIIKALRVRTFDWKEGFGNNRKGEVGFIAQEVEAVKPSAVSSWEMDTPTGEVDEDGKPITEKVDYKTVGPGTFLPDVIDALQEAQARIEALEARLEALEA